MTTYDLTGDLSSLVGVDFSPSDVNAFLSAIGYVLEGTQVRFGGVPITVEADGTFELEDIAESATPVYTFTAVWRTGLPGVPLQRLEVGPFALTADTDLSEVSTDVFTAIPRPSLDHGNVSGAVSLSAAYGLHELTLTGDAVLTPVGQAGSDLAVLIHPDSHQVTLGGSANWFGGAPTLTDDDATLTFALFPVGWLAYAAGAVEGEPVEVTPTFDDGTDFDDTGNVLTIPADTGVQYKQDGVNIAAGTHSAQPSGLTEITAVAKSGYVLAAGTWEWDHTFPAPSGWSTWDLMEFTAADGTSADTVDTQESRNYTLSGTANVNTNRIKIGQSSTAVNHVLHLAGLPGDRFRHSIDFDLTDEGGGHNPKVKLQTNCATGNIFVYVEGYDGGTKSAVRAGGDFVSPTIDYEAGEDEFDNVPAGTLTMECDPVAELVSIYVDTVLIGTIDTSGLAHAMVATEAWVGVPSGSNNYAEYDNHLIEVYT